MNSEKFQHFLYASISIWEQEEGMSMRQHFSVSGNECRLTEGTGMIATYLYLVG